MQPDLDVMVANEKAKLAANARYEVQQLPGRPMFVGIEYDEPALRAFVAFTIAETYAKFWPPLLGVVVRCSPPTKPLKPNRRRIKSIELPATINVGLTCDARLEVVATDGG